MEGGRGGAAGGPRKWRWYHGVLFYVGVQAAGFGLAKLVSLAGGRGRPLAGEALAGNSANSDYYNSLRRPVFAPPDWLFPPVWTLNNALCIWGLLRVLNVPEGEPGRERFLKLQAGAWAVFVAFNAVYFGLRSPVGGALLTVADLALTIETVRVALDELEDTGAALSQSTVLPWLVVAAATSVPMAAWNEDEFFGTGPAVEPPPAWVKQTA